MYTSIFINDTQKMVYTEPLLYTVKESGKDIPCILQINYSFLSIAVHLTKIGDVIIFLVKVVPKHFNMLW
ncbi:hypothetical protein CN380_18485 [Bacillus sp. AFS017274]|nr:hypothetical protein CN380_18485 [Bacillus sp. AFS017274]